MIRRTDLYVAAGGCRPPVPGGRQGRDLRPWPPGEVGTTLGGMTQEELNGSRARHLERSRRDRVLGGVCAGIADHLGLDVLLVRIAVVVLVVVSGGAALLAYLLAWMLVPPASGEQPTARPRPVADNGSARDAWTAAGGELRSLAAGLRPVAGPDVDPERRDRSRAAAVDAAMTKLGDRLRDPEVLAGARRTATSLSTAVGASVEELGRRSRRNGAAPGDKPSG